MSQLTWQDYSHSHFGSGIPHSSPGGEVSEPQVYSPYFASVPGMVYPYPMPYMMYAAQEPRTTPQDYQTVLRRLEALNLRENQLVQQLKSIDSASCGSTVPEIATEELKKLAFERVQMMARLQTPSHQLMDASSPSSTSSAPSSRSSTPGPSTDVSANAGWVSPSQTQVGSSQSESASVSPNTSPRVVGPMIIPPLRLPFGYESAPSNAPSPKTPLLSPIPQLSPTDLLALERLSIQQASAGIVLPRIVVRINVPAVQAAGCHDLSMLTVQCVARPGDDTPAFSPTSRKGELIEGSTVVPVDSDATASFAAVRFTEAAAKYDDVVLYFHLFKYDPVIGRTPIGSVVSSPVLVQSRLNKRKRGSFLANPPPAPDGERSSSPMPQLRASKLRPTSPPPPEASAYPINGSPDSIFVDITDLLALPQKEAATKLGISESMLCKRFKECTRRKWPYRYLRKIEKQISALESTPGGLTPDEQSRLESLRLEREDCLCPVKIRITNHDKALGALSASSSSSTLACGNNTSSMPLSPSSSFSPDDVSPRSAFDGMSPRSDSSSDRDMDMSDQDEMNYKSVIETLEMLRNSSASPPPPAQQSPTSSAPQIAVFQQ